MPQSVLEYKRNGLSIEILYEGEPQTIYEGVLPRLLQLITALDTIAGASSFVCAKVGNLYQYDWTAADNRHWAQTVETVPSGADDAWLTFDVTDQWTQAETRQHLAITTVLLVAIADIGLQSIEVTRV